MWGKTKTERVKELTVEMKVEIKVLIILIIGSLWFLKCGPKMYVSSKISYEPIYVKTKIVVNVGPAKSSLIEEAIKNDLTRSLFPLSVESGEDLTIYVDILSAGTPTFVGGVVDLELAIEFSDKTTRKKYIALGRSGWKGIIYSSQMVMDAVKNGMEKIKQEISRDRFEILTLAEKTKRQYKIQPSEIEEETPSVKVCPQCGKEYPESYSRCPKCGVKLKPKE